MNLSWIDLVFPVLGLDRSTKFQSQPPYTTPDAVNVRTEEMATYRERGGSRPGLGLGIRTQLPGPVRMLTKIAVLRSEWPKNHIPIYGGQLDGGLTTPVWATAGEYISSRSSYQGEGSYLRGANFGAELPITYFDARDVTQLYESSFFLRPPTGSLMVGIATIYVGLPDAAADPLQDSIECRLVMGTAGYYVEVNEYSGGVLIDTTVSSVITSDLGLPGTFAARVRPATNTITVFWRRNQLVTHVASGLAGHRSSFLVESDDESMHATKFKADFEWSTTVPRANRSQRRDLLVAVSEGNIYLEDSADSLELAVTGGLNSDAELMSAEREQKLYIADYGIAISGVQAATIANPAYDTLQDVSKNFTALGIDNNYAVELVDSDYFQNETQVVSLFNTDGGTYRLGFRGAFTSPIPQGSSGAGVELILEALSTIGAGNVDVTGSGGGPHTVEFKGTLSGTNLELMTYQADGLTDSGGGTPSMEITETQVGAGGEFVRGTYAVSSVAGDSITFTPPIPATSGLSIGDVTYNVVRAAKIFDPNLSTLTVHSATTGSVPAGCRLVTLYRDRIVYAANDVEPHVWYMSRQGDPHDWDYSQEDSAAAIFAQSSIGGQLADPITALIAHGDECLIVGCYNSLWIIRGDPGYGGTQDQLSRLIGIIGPDAWCRTPDDMCVFLSPDGLYVMPAGCHGYPTSLSRERVPDELIGLTQEREVVKLEFDTIHRGIHIFTTKHDGSHAAHWWYDWEAKSFWNVSLQVSHEPFSLHQRIAWDDVPIVLLGGRDGYIRYFSRDFEVDDEDHEIESHVVLGPLHLDRGGYMEGILQSLDATVGATSGPVQWEVRAGDSASNAITNDIREEGIWNRNGVNFRVRPRVRGIACTLTIRNFGKQRWFFDRILATMRPAGRKRVR